MTSTIGIPYPGNAMLIVDITDPTREMPLGERGELMSRGPLVMLGYYGNEEGTVATIEPDGWLHTGDVALCSHPAVALAAVGGISDETKGELAKAYVVLQPATDVTREDLTTHCREHLAAYKVPRAIQFTTELREAPHRTGD